MPAAAPSGERLQDTRSKHEVPHSGIQHSRSLGADLANLLHSTTVPILLLDRELRLCQITPAAGDLLHLQPGDLGDRISKVEIGSGIEAIERLADSVIQTEQPQELEWQDRDHCWYTVRGRPYRNADSQVEGAVLVLIDINELRELRTRADSARAFAENVLQSTRIPLLVLRTDFQIRFANTAFYQHFEGIVAETEHRSFFEIGSGRWELPSLRTALEKLLTTSGAIDELEFEREFAGLGRRTVCINARVIQPDGEILILLAVEDITAQKRAERLLLDEQARLELSVHSGTQELRKATKTLRKEVSGRRRAEVALSESKTALIESRQQLQELAGSLIDTQEKERRRVSLELHDDLSQKVAKLQFDVEGLEQQLSPDLIGVRQTLQNVVEQAGALSNDIRRVAHQLHPSALHHLGLVVAIRSYVQEFSRSTAIQVRFTDHKVPRDIPVALASCLYRIVQEALRNVGKHAGMATVEIGLMGTPGGLELSIKDDGDGFDLESKRTKGGLGLIGMRERVRLAGGSFALEAQQGQGVKITIHVSLQRVGV